MTHCAGSSPIVRRFTTDVAEVRAMNRQRQPSREEFIRFNCACGRRIKAPANLAGKPGRCLCGARPLVPFHTVPVGVVGSIDASVDTASLGTAAQEPPGWYWRDADSGKQVGPIPESAMAKLVESGAVTRSTLVRRADAATWGPAETWWEDFPEDQSSPRMGQSSAFVPAEQVERPLTAPAMGHQVPMGYLPAQAMPVQHIVVTMRKERQASSPSVLSNVILWIVGGWTVICLIMAMLMTRRVLGKIDAKELTFDKVAEGFFAMLLLFGIIWFVPAVIGTLVAIAAKKR